MKLKYKSTAAQLPAARIHAPMNLGKTRVESGRQGRHRLEIIMKRRHSPIPLTGLLALTLAASLPACGRSEPPATQTPPAAVEQAPPPPPAVGIYVTNEASGELSIIDAATQSVAT